MPKIIEYRSNAKKALKSPEIEKLKAEKLESDKRLADERRRQVEAQRKLTEMEVKRREGELVEQELVHRQIAYCFTVLKERVLSIPSQITCRLDVSREHKHKARMHADAKVREALEEMAASLNMPNEEWQEEVERS